MNTISRITAAATASLAMLALAVPAVTASSGTRIALRPSSAFPGATGTATVKASGERELQVEVEHVRRLAGKTLAVTVGARKIGTMRVSGLGAAELHRRGAAVPAIGPGTAVTVRTAGGALVVSGAR